METYDDYLFKKGILNNEDGEEYIVQLSDKSDYKN